MKEHFRIETQPVADPANVVQGERYRITVLETGLVRLEWSDDGVFEDRASQTAGTSPPSAGPGSALAGNRPAGSADVGTG